MMQIETNTTQQRRPRFRRVAKPPAFRLTEGDVTIIRHVARHRFLKSIQIAALVGRSLDRTNDRLSLLFHAGYLDRPRAQLDRFPTEGSSYMVYALADLGAKLLRSIDGVIPVNQDLSRKNKLVLRPFIEHQLEIMDFYVALQCAVRDRADVALIHPEELIDAFPATTRSDKNPLKLKASMMDNGRIQEFGLIPDMVFGLKFADGSRRCFMVEIDRGTMPITRRDQSVTSYAMKMRAYLAAQAAGLHELRYGWKAFRVLTITTDAKRVQSMTAALKASPAPQGPGASLFFFTTRDQVTAQSPLTLDWLDGHGRKVGLV